MTVIAKKKFKPFTARPSDEFRFGFSNHQCGVTFRGLEGTVDAVMMFEVQRGTEIACHLRINGQYVPVVPSRIDWPSGQISLMS